MEPGFPCRGAGGTAPDSGNLPPDPVVAHSPARRKDRASACGRSRPADPAGHRTVPHTADLRIEAWAPSREECLAEAARGLVDSFAVVRGLPPRSRVRRHMAARLDEDLLVAVIDEIIYRLDADSEIPVSVAVRRAPDGGVVVFFALVPVTEAEIIGAIPKAASLHDLRCAPDAAGRWSCAVTVDV